MASKGINKVILIGNLGQDPETRYMPNGNAVTNLSLATSESWKDDNGQLHEKTEWHRIVTFNKLAEIAGEHLKKGSKVFIEGKLKTRSYEQDGVKKYATEIVASEMQFLDTKGDGGSKPAAGQGASSQQPKQAASDFDDFDDSIPF